MSAMSGNHLTVLVVEDNLGDARLIERTLEDASGSFVVEHADRIARAIDRLAAGGIDIVLLDLSLPDSSGLQTFALVRSCAEDVPIVVLTGLDDEEAATAAVQAGAQDYLVKGTFDSEVIARSVRYAVERHRMQEDLRRLATVDDLTGLFNRRGFLPLAEHHLNLSDRNGEPLVLLFIDLDGLKKVNDVHGHAEGSRMIQDTASVLTKTLRNSDVLARVGGDEFCVLLTAEDAMNAERVLVRLVEAVAAHNARAGREYVLSLSVGAAPYDPTEPCSIEELMERADALMYEEKQRHHRGREAG
jgi:two-component system, cell cycle response regulator